MICHAFRTMRYLVAQVVDAVALLLNTDTLADDDPLDDPIGSFWDAEAAAHANRQHRAT